MPGSYFTFDGQLVTAAGDAFIQVANDLQSAFADWEGVQPKAVEGLGDEAGADYEAQLAAPLRQRQTEIVSGLHDWSSQLSAWATTTQGADQDASAGFNSVEVPPVETY